MLLLIVISLGEAIGQQCYGVAFEGGGAKGAYEAGVLSILTNPANNINVQYNIITGISIGALTTMIIGNYSVGQEQQMSQQLTNMWFSIQNNSDLFVEWPGGLIEGILFKSSIYNNARSIKFFRSYFGTPQRNVRVGATNLDTGLLQYFDQSIGASFFDGAISSASIPVAFPPHIMEGHAFADGGCVTNLDIPSAVEYCLNITGNQRQITIDIITDEFYSNLANETSFKTRDVLERVYSIQKYDNNAWYLYNTMQAYENVNYRYIAIPSKQLNGSLNFDSSAIRSNYNIGVQDALNLLKSTKNDRATFISQELKRTSLVIYP